MFRETCKELARRLILLCFFGVARLLFKAYSRLQGTESAKSNKLTDCVIAAARLYFKR